MKILRKIDIIIIIWNVLLLTVARGPVGEGQKMRVAVAKLPKVTPRESQTLRRPVFIFPLVYHPLLIAEFCE